MEKKNKINKIICNILIFGVPMAYLLYELYLLMFQLGNNKDIIYTNLEGMFAFFGIYAFAIILNYILVKRKSKFLLYFFAFFEFIGVILYVLAKPKIDGLIDIFNIVLFTTPFITAILQNLNIDDLDTM